MSQNSSPSWPQPGGTTSDNDKAMSSGDADGRAGGLSVEELAPGDQVVLGGQNAEVIRLHTVGELPYIRAYVEGEGVKSVCADHVYIDRRSENGGGGEAAHALEELTTRSSERFDLRMQAVRFRLAHRRGQLLSISNSLVRLEPYQLACVNEVMGRLRQRVLIADDVGLGKTIEAGLILKELEARQRAARVLFVVPAHLRKKWVREMKRYFGIHLSVGDRAWVEGEHRRLGDEANIWNQDRQRLITSLSFVRQDEFESALQESFWDVVVVDECHKASKKGQNPSRTSRRIEQIAHQSEALLLLSATPHTGKEESLRSLLSYIDPFLISAEQDLTRETVEQVMVRRGKETIFDDDGERIFPERDVQTVGVVMTDAEKEFYESVSEYVRVIYNRSEKLGEPVVGLAMALMQKRLVSSVGAIRATLRRRLHGLLEKDGQGSAEALSEAASSYAAGDDLDEEEQVQAEQEIEQLTAESGDEALKEEVRALRRLVKMAGELAVDSKAHKVRSYIQQLLEEEPQEKVLLFTEYRDTLDYVLALLEGERWYDEIMVIHGGVDKEARARIEREFNHGTARLLFATDAASEGIDLQESCHIMVNYELTWNPNRLEQRIGRLHRYGQEREVKVLNFQFEGTRESEIFSLLTKKIENIRARVGSTADVLGMVEDLGVEDLIMRSLRHNEPLPATEEELESELEEREATLRDWYTRSLIDPSTFDAESRSKIRAVMDESEEAFGAPEDVQSFAVRALRALGGEAERAGLSSFRVEVPEALRQRGEDAFGEQRGHGERDRRSERMVTFDRDRAMDDENLEYLSPDHPLVESLARYVLNREESGFGGYRGLKKLSFINAPGIAYSYRVAFEDAAGETLREELVPLFVEPEKCDPHRGTGERVLRQHSLAGRVDRATLRQLADKEEELRAAAEAHLSRYIRRTREKLRAERRRQVEREIESIDAYGKAERERLGRFIEEYEQREAAGEDMQIAIRGQKNRLRTLRERLEERKEGVRAKSQVAALEPELMGWCATLPG